MNYYVVYSLLIIHSITLIVLVIYAFSNSDNKSNCKNIKFNKNNKEEKEDEITKLRKMKEVSLTIPLTEKSRPKDFKEIIGQEKGIKALKAAICGPNPQHVIIYGPPGVGKTAAARLVLDEAKKIKISPFKEDAKFIEIDATTVRFDERGIADPLIGSVHDPIYQGAGPLGTDGIPQPKIGAVTKAHGGILFIDEIGELHPTEMNKLLKVLEDRKVFLESAYYNPEDEKLPIYIKEVFEEGLPADFRLIGATTRSPEEIAPAIRSRCVEIFFKELETEETELIADNAMKKIGLNIEENAKKLAGAYSNNGRDAVNLVQLASGIAINDNRDTVTVQDIEWVIENGQYTLRQVKKIRHVSSVGVVNGLAVYGCNIGILMEIEATAIKVKRRGKIKVTGIIEEEEIKNSNKKIKRKSIVSCSVQNVLTVLDKIFNINTDNYDIHINYPGGTPIDGPSAGITMATAIYSAITGLKIDNKIAMTGEISIYGDVKAVGGVNAKIQAAKKAGVKKVIIPKENFQENFNNIEGITVVPVTNIKEVMKEALINHSNHFKKEKIDILAAKSADI